jgi:hypothetical protein
MSAQQPGIVECQDDRYPPAQLKEHAKIKVTSVEVVTVDNVWPLLRQA